MPPKTEGSQNETTESFCTSTKKAPALLYGQYRPPAPTTEATAQGSVPGVGSAAPLRLQRINVGGGHSKVQLTSTMTAADLCEAIATRRGISSQLALLLEGSAGPRRLAEDALLVEAARAETLKPNSIVRVAIDEKKDASSQAPGPLLQVLEEGEVLRAEPLPTMMSPTGACLAASAAQRRATPC